MDGERVDSHAVLPETWIKGLQPANSRAPL